MKEHIRLTVWFSKVAFNLMGCKMKEFISVNEKFTQEMCQEMFGKDTDEMPFDFVGSDASKLNGKCVTLEEGKSVILSNCRIRPESFSCGFECCGTSHYQLLALGELVVGVECKSC